MRIDHLQKTALHALLLMGGGTAFGARNPAPAGTSRPPYPAAHPLGRFEADVSYPDTIFEATQASVSRAGRQVPDSGLEPSSPWRRGELARMSPTQVIEEYFDLQGALFGKSPTGPVSRHPETFAAHAVGAYRNAGLVGVARSGQDVSMLQRILGEARMWWASLAQAVGKLTQRPPRGADDATRAKIAYHNQQLQIEARRLADIVRHNTATGAPLALAIEPQRHLGYAMEIIMAGYQDRLARSQQAEAAQRAANAEQVKAAQRAYDANGPDNVVVSADRGLIVYKSLDALTRFGPRGETVAGSFAPTLVMSSGAGPLGAARYAPPVQALYFLNPAGQRVHVFLRRDRFLVDGDTRWTPIPEDQPYNRVQQDTVRQEVSRRVAEAGPQLAENHFDFGAPYSQGEHARNPDAGSERDEG